MSSDITFQEYGVIDVLNFNASPENPDLGYLCGGIVTVFSDGRIKIYNADKDGELLEDFHVRDLIRVSSNINNFDPEQLTKAALTTRVKQIRIAFKDTEEKYRLAETLGNLSI